MQQDGWSWLLVSAVIGIILWACIIATIMVAGTYNLEPNRQVVEEPHDR